MYAVKNSSQFIHFCSFANKKMNSKDLYNKLVIAYSTENLNRISMILIELFKNKQTSTLQKIAELIDDQRIWDFEHGQKDFSKLLMLYHPDRRLIHIENIEKAQKQENTDALLEYSHILRLEKIENFINETIDWEDIDYSPVYEWDFNQTGFSIFNQDGKIIHEFENKNFKTKQSSYTFYEAIKMRMYGTLDIEFPSYYLEDIDELELVEAGIDDLSGVEYCIHTSALDLSSNQISDLSPLWTLKNLKEINLSNNNISILDYLSNLENIQTIYLAENEITDISSIMFLQKLKYIDLSGNDIPYDQIMELRDSGVEVVFD